MQVSTLTECDLVSEADGMPLTHASAPGNMIGHLEQLSTSSLATVQFKSRPQVLVPQILDHMGWHATAK